MAIQQYPNGIGGSLGDSLALARPLTMSGSVWYVHAATGTDLGGVAGQNREKPLASLVQAVANSADGDVIVFLDGHTQTLTAAQTISKNLTLVGEGSSGGKPTVKFTNNQAAANLFTISGAAVKLRNLWIKANAQSSNTVRIAVTGASFEMRGCYVECGATDVAAAVSLGAGANNARIVNTTFISTATLTSAQPSSALVSGAALSDIDIEGCVFSAGTVGFSSYLALDMSHTITRLRGEAISLLLGADALIGASSVGYFNVSICTGGSRVTW